MKRDKIGILTFHNANNYGAVLQAYALQKKLKHLYPDASVQIINYRCNAISSQRELKALIQRQGLTSALIHYPGTLRRVKKIDRFCQKHMDMTELVTDHSELKRLAKQFDVIISGSDQIWNRRWNGNDDAYLQSFHSKHGKKISYAVSFGMERLPSDWVDEYRASIGQFKMISVREAAGQKIIRNQLGLKAAIHVDPTLLLSAEDWGELETSPSIKRPYVLVYMVPFQRNILEFAQQMCKTGDLKMVVVCKSLKKTGGIYKGAASVEEIIGLFKNAEYVVTNSFHGTAFSVIFQKKLAIDLNNPRGYNSRSENLLVSCKMLDSKCHFSGVIQLFNTDWKLVSDNILNEKRSSEKYLQDILDNREEI